MTDHGPSAVPQVKPWADEEQSAEICEGGLEAIFYSPAMPMDDPALGKGRSGYRRWLKDEERLLIRAALLAASASSSTAPQEQEVQIEMRVPFPLYGRLGIGAEAWAELTGREIETLNNKSAVYLSVRTFQTVMNALRHCGEKHYINPSSIVSSPQDAQEPTSCKEWREELKSASSSTPSPRENVK
jgi:hypothetical protein